MKNKKLLEKLNLDFISYGAPELEEHFGVKTYVKKAKQLLERVNIEQFGKYRMGLTSNEDYPRRGQRMLDIMKNIKAIRKNYIKK